ncbi:Ig-like domain-containing protein, partial [Wohlfahrtiimonas larvae]|uniref:Ig-like domain-containing protein n=2 Tax=Wohlfahrtiimonas larvae TaxID=1157986 RepID=UPI0031EDEF99
MIKYIMDRRNGDKTIMNSSSVKLTGSQVVVIQASRIDIEFITQQGNALVIKLKSGQLLVIQDYFINPQNELVIDDSLNQNDGLYLIEGNNWSQIESVDTLLIQDSTMDGEWLPWTIGLGLLGVGGAVAASSSGGSNDYVISLPNNISAPKVLVNNGNDLSGTGVPNTTIILTKSDGSTVIVTVDATGNWSFGDNPLNDGEKGTLITLTEDGNKSSPTDTGIADKSTIDPIVEVNNALLLAGKSEPNATIILTLPNGNKVGTVADKNGDWKFADPNPLSEGEKGELVAIDKAGNISGKVSVEGGDITPPDAPVVDVNGPILSGTGEAGSTITLTKPNGDTETTTVDGNGNWSFDPNPLDNGETGTVTATDPSGNTSGSTSTGVTD